MVNHMPKDVYMQLSSDVLHDANPDVIRTLLAYRQHQDPELLVRNCNVLYTNSEYNRATNIGKEPSAP